MDASANGIAIFACSGADLFETIQLNAPLEDNYLYVYNQPHLYHLTRSGRRLPSIRGAADGREQRRASSCSDSEKRSKPSR